MKMHSGSNKIIMEMLINNSKDMSYETFVPFLELPKCFAFSVMLLTSTWWPMRWRFFFPFTWLALTDNAVGYCRESCGVCSSSVMYFRHFSNVYNMNFWFAIFLLIFKCLQLKTAARLAGQSHVIVSRFNSNIVAIGILVMSFQCFSKT